MSRTTQQPHEANSHHNSSTTSRFTEGSYLGTYGGSPISCPAGAPAAAASDAHTIANVHSHNQPHGDGGGGRWRKNDRHEGKRLHLRRCCLGAHEPAHCIYFIKENDCVHKNRSSCICSALLVTKHPAPCRPLGLCFVSLIVPSRWRSLSDGHLKGSLPVSPLSVVCGVKDGEGGMKRGRWIFYFPFPSVHFSSERLVPERTNPTTVRSSTIRW